ncbi:COG1361 family protein [Thermococcus thioreducens]|uniref:hypothetical protein n=1 Tax=Thermococcus thioreducens TaxID=277988 RepID=UPI001B7FF5A7|nr:hypothetical protein [Thermococcus thioreducens]
MVGIENGNLSLAPELIQNSRLGAENAANISALIWQALEELKASGVKTYYTAEELREMAQNISENGLPQETVDALKAQGWTDAQIRALEEYIVQNGANITEDFNMTAFLEEFSMAFISVAFKYNHYEAWALEKWKWTQPAEAPTLNNEELINPVLADPWVQFYHAYAVSDYVGMEDSIEALRDSAYNFLTYQEKFVSLTFLRNGSVITKTGTLGRVEWTENGSMVFTTLVTSPSEDGFMLNTTTYYWPSALRAYELTSNIMTLVKARNCGNNNSEVQWMLNQKVAELRSALKVIIVSTSTSTVQVPNEPIYPIEPIDPIYPIDPKLPVLPVSTTSPEESTTAELSESTTVITPADETALLALDPNNEEGRLVVDSVNVEAVEVTSDYVTYKVAVHLHVEDNAVSNVNLEFQGTELSDSKSMGFLYPGDSFVVESTVSGRVYGSDQVTVSGTVKITYTPSSGQIPNSVSPANDEREITESYSKTIPLEEGIDPSKVYVSVLAQDENGDGTVKTGEDVTFKVVVRNDNDVNIAGTCTIRIVYPISSSDTSARSFSVSVNAPAGGSATETFGSVHYAWSGTFTYTGKCTFDQYEKSFSGYVTVEEDDSTDPTVVKMIDVVPTSWPSTARLGGSVEFSVDLKNTYPVDKSVKVELKIDGTVVDVVEVTVIAGRSTGILLHWNVPDDFPVGEHSVKIQAFSRNLDSNDSWNPEDSETGSINVERPKDLLFGKLVPNVNGTVVQGTVVHFDVIVENKEDYPAYNVPIRVFYTYQTPNGGFSDPIRVFERNPRQIDGLGVNLTWFNMTLTNLGKYYFTLYVNGEIEDEKIITVTSNSSVMAWMECEDTIPLYDELSCHIHILNNSSDDVSIQVTKVMFGGYEVWNGENWKAVMVNYITGTTIKRHSEGIIYIGIDVDGWLSERVFGDDYYIYLFLDGGQPKEHIINVDLRLNDTRRVLGYTVTVYSGDDKEGGKIETADYILKSAQVAGGASTVLGFVLAIGGNPTGLIIAGIGFGALVLTTVGYSTYKGITAPTPTCSQESDNNLICGG